MMPRPSPSQQSSSSTAGLRVLALAAALCLCATALPRAAAVKGISGWSSGEITHFGGAQDGMDPSSASFGTKEGSCGYGAIPADRYPYFSTAALAPSNSFYQADQLHGCGQCFQIQCADQRSGVCKTDAAGKPLSVLVMISDECPECGASHIDVQSLAFAKLADPGIGRIGMQYRRVECAPPQDMQVSVMDYAGPGGWIRLAVDNTGGRAAVTSVAVKGSDGGDWRPMANSWGATWEMGSAPKPPLSFKIVGDDGEEVVATDVIKQAGGISGGANGPRAAFSTAAQFTITDPAFTAGGVPKVSAFDGPSDAGSDPMLVTSATPGADGAPSSSSSGGRPPSAGSRSAGAAPTSERFSSQSASGSGCRDVPTPDGHSCADQKGWGKCQESFIRDNGYCKQTCGACGASQPAVQAASGPSGGGRKMLRRLR